MRVQKKRISPIEETETAYTEELRAYKHQGPLSGEMNIISTLVELQITCPNRPCAAAGIYAAGFESGFFYLGHGVCLPKLDKALTKWHP